MYRSFNLIGLSERDFFSNQLDLVRSACNHDSVLIGDLNLDYNKRFDVNYSRENLFELFDNKLGELNLIQIVNLTPGLEWWVWC